MPQPEEPEDRGDPSNAGDPMDPELAAWREIVAHYGERAELAPGDPEAYDDRDGDPWPGSGPVGGAGAASGPSYPARFGVFDDDVDGADEPFDPLLDDPDEGGFVPPEPEPMRLTPARTAAWLGVLGAPLLAVLATVVVSATTVTVPTWFVGLLVCAFLGGFGYLVLTMPRDRDDPWDDGARL